MAEKHTKDTSGLHRHILQDGTVIEHSHEMHHDHGGEHTHGSEYTHEHTHGSEHTHGGHTHTHQNTKAVLNRMARAAGHLDKVRGMIEEGRDCSEVLIQLSAVISALKGAGKLILKDHMEHCMVDAVRSGDLQMIEELTEAIDRFIK